MNGEDSGGDSAYTDDGGEASPQTDQEENVSATEIDLRTGNRSDERTNDEFVREARKAGREHRNAYRELLNKTIEDVIYPYNQSLDVAGDYLAPSLIGASSWTSAEKEAFFHALPRLGRDDIKGIAAAIGTKSEPEVRAFILLLNESTPGHDGLLSYSLPAAEISRNCEVALEAAADALAEEQLEREQKTERKRHGDFWLLTEDVAAEIETGLEKQQITHDAQDGQALDSAREDTHPVPAARLLNLPNWLEVAQHFMWQGDESSENWTNFVQANNETPSIYHTAFQDFHNLATSITRRLLQATIFQAQSRMRARDISTGSTSIYPADVRAAARILEIGTNRRHFWGRMPRRHGIQVYVREEKPQQQPNEDGMTEYRYGNLRRISYDEVEAKLGVSDEDAVDIVQDQPDAAILYDDLDMWTEESLSEDETAPTGQDNQVPDEVVQPSENAPKRRRDHMKLHESQVDAYVDARDVMFSREDEEGLWQMLELPVPVSVKAEEAPLPPWPASKGLKRNAATNWRDVVEYEAEWERDMVSIPPSAFTAMQRRGQLGRKRRKLFCEQIKERGASPVHLSIRKEDFSDDSEESRGVETSSEDEDDDEDDDPDQEAHSNAYPQTEVHAEETREHSGDPTSPPNADMENAPGTPQATQPGNGSTTAVAGPSTGGQADLDPVKPSANTLTQSPAVALLQRESVESPSSDEEDDDSDASDVPLLQELRAAPRAAPAPRSPSPKPNSVEGNSDEEGDGALAELARFQRRQGNIKKATEGVRKQQR